MRSDGRGRQRGGEELPPLPRALPGRAPRALRGPAAAATATRRRRRGARRGGRGQGQGRGARGRAPAAGPAPAAAAAARAHHGGGGGGREPGPLPAAALQVVSAGSPGARASPSPRGWCFKPPLDKASRGMGWDVLPFPPA